MSSKMNPKLQPLTFDSVSESQQLEKKITFSLEHKIGLFCL